MQMLPTKTTERMDKLRRRAIKYSSLQRTIALRALAGALLFVALEGYRWLETGRWEPLDGWSTVRLFTTGGWLDAPDSWLGLHRLVGYLLDVPLYVTGPLLFWAGTGGACAVVVVVCEGEIGGIKQQAGMGVLDRPETNAQGPSPKGD